MTVAARTACDGITHAVTSRVNFVHFAGTACGVHVYWRTTFKGQMSSDFEKDLRPNFADQTDKEVDCMACIAKGASE